MLNREECENALTRLLRPYFAKVDVQSVYHSINKGHSIEDDSNLLTLLIMEYFDNPPLKFEELKEGMFVWDNKRKWIWILFRKRLYLRITGNHGRNWIRRRT